MMFVIVITKISDSLNLLPFLLVSWDSLLLARSEIYTMGFLLYQTYFFSFLVLALLITFTLVGSIFSTRDAVKPVKFQLKIYKKN